jgi:hypothetical protein
MATKRQSSAAPEADHQEANQLTNRIGREP